MMKNKILLSLFAIPATSTAGNIYQDADRVIPSKNVQEIYVSDSERDIIFLKGIQMHTNGVMPQIGDKAPNFTGTDKDLKETSLKNFKGKRIVLNIFPCLDTPTCAASVRHFNEMVSKKTKQLYCVSP